MRYQSVRTLDIRNSSKSGSVEYVESEHILAYIHTTPVFFQICNKKLSNKHKLKYHMSVHSERRAYQCGECETKFKGRENLVKHVVAQHGKAKEDVLASLRRGKAA